MVTEYPDKEIKILYYRTERVHRNDLLDMGNSEHIVIVYYWSDGRVTWKVGDEILRF